MPVQEMLLVALAAFGAGAINVVAGSGTLITFPTLIAFGYPPVVATMSNAIGLTVGSMTGVWGYRRELSGQWPRLKWQIPAVLIGALIGSFLLLHLPEKTFVTIVPVLLILALVVVGPRIQAWARRRSEAQGLSADHVPPGRMAALTGGNFLVGIYGGYFTAAQGIMQIAVMGALLPESMQRMNAAKNVLAMITNIVAALAYTIVAFDRVSWTAAGIIAAGSFAGGLAGARWGRKLSPGALRVVIVAVGLIGLWRLLF
ncbi:sulfite exporter TauE/SafE family protein [Mycobacteroides chelonae]|uniref:Probable membrane transporter protein n=1 Tax=Mycobacteroides chelonae TaxID=1774 RepID=A0AB73U5P1_MYCCH|nr:sulfite exporter TauE/SafE family protein [Mycobacteroides chelonae]MEC4842172.1 sulfite exporter TauE/SafE family protein [Mycobacteroides chelonae]MEC4847010.1 sulfite exporter TauE/SafE family protein [Mycobacteroides chelonae]QDF72409.1 sulfite exporter TauE/SafE family protein [Mycobacteroides chelonae]WED91292.1 sulfite exporter TauE/SafE family protein [Mycobacteroides chelonae]WED96233.1 sulfite exporter TauE/SafE family protein [Mycobacteroides chelonae]